MFRATKRALISAALVIALSSPAAAVATIRISYESGVAQQPITTQQQQRLDRLKTTVEQRFASEGGWHLAAASVSATGSSSGQGVEWGDAGIGAAGMVVLLGAGVAASGTVRRRRVIG